MPNFVRYWNICSVNMMATQATSENVANESPRHHDRSSKKAASAAGQPEAVDELPEVSSQPIEVISSKL